MCLAHAPLRRLLPVVTVHCSTEGWEEVQLTGSSYIDIDIDHR